MLETIQNRSIRCGSIGQMLGIPISSDFEISPDFLGFLALSQSRQFFHADDSDIVGLLCVARALEGGESDIVSAHHVYNVLRRERPDVLETLTKPNWYFDRKGEVSEGEEPYVRSAVFYLESGADGRVYSKYGFSSLPPCLSLTGPKVRSILHPISHSVLRRGSDSSPFAGSTRSGRRPRRNL